MILTVFAGIAEFERELVRGRTENGRKAALQRGVVFGRPSKLGSEQRDTVRQLIENGKSVKEVARTFKVHPATIYRCIDQVRSCPASGVPYGGL